MVKEIRLERGSDVQVTHDPKRSIALQFDGYRVVEAEVAPAAPAKPPTK